MRRGEGIPRLEYPEPLLRWAEGRETPHGRATGCTWSGGGVEDVLIDDGHGRQVRALRWLGDVPTVRYRSAIRVRPMDQDVREALGCIGLRDGVAGAPPSSTRSWLGRMHRWGCGQRTRIVEGRRLDAQRPARDGVAGARLLPQDGLGRQEHRTEVGRVGLFAAFLLGYRDTAKRQGEKGTQDGQGPRGRSFTSLDRPQLRRTSTRDGSQMPQVRSRKDAEVLCARGSVEDNI
ncbi:hypothetical protein GGX14DRAFT_632452 [Mycena pura]|uniref:Uncharacterized protein n=1 Tax=Mycena pura TaxID=153505 RepID=A0AAD6YB12_9AGAR|nr:hypothetical protein GGX14DRAFT_632452 [Mycena pura]